MHRLSILNWIGDAAQEFIMEGGDAGVVYASLGNMGSLSKSPPA